MFGMLRNMWGARRKRPLMQRPRYRPQVEDLEARCLLSNNYLQTNLVSDMAGVARAMDPNLVNPWGLSFAPGGPFWVSNNNSGLSTVYDAQGNNQGIVVSIPPGAASPAGTPGTPTGTVSYGGAGFVISKAGNSGPSLFLFATEDGTISGWNPAVDPSHAVLGVDNSMKPTAANGAVYKGLAIGTDSAGRTLLYAPNFRSGSVDVFDQAFYPTLAGTFQDSTIPAGFAPFNIEDLGGDLYVTYAKQDAARHDPVAGAGSGFVDVFNTNGTLLRRLAPGGALNAPWGLALAPAGFAAFGNDLLVGNFGDGRINAFNPQSGTFQGQLDDGLGQPISIQGLWALKFGGGGQSGDPGTLFFSAGPSQEQHGLFGSLQPTAPVVSGTGADLIGRVAATGQWWLGVSNGSSAFTNNLATAWSPSVAWADVHTGDFTGSGKQDLIGRNPTTGEWMVSVANGAGGYTSSVWGTWSTAVHWVDVQVGDFNGDGKMDIVGRVQETGEWWVGMSSGSSFVTTKWGAWAAGTPGVLDWVDVQVGDVDGDGKADVIGRIKETGQWWVNRSTGTSFVTSLYTTWAPDSASLTWVDVHLADFNADGKADLLGRVLQSGQWWVTLSAGATAGSTTLWATWSPMVNWVDVKIGDFNGDGKADVIGRVQSTGQWWLGASTGSSLTTTLWTTWSSAVTWVDVQVADFNGDGKADLAGRVQSSGQWWVSQSAGTTAASTGLWTTWSTAVTWVDVHSGKLA
jgi:uncharacterized protein (TIGR03118 family)